MSAGRCRSCDAPIIWATTGTGKSMPLDAEPVEIPRGLFELIGDEVGSPVRPPLYRSHFATCPNADKHRK